MAAGSFPGNFSEGTGPHVIGLLCILLVEPQEATWLTCSRLFNTPGDQKSTKRKAAPENDAFIFEFRKSNDFGAAVAEYLLRDYAGIYSELNMYLPFLPLQPS